jgi:hypothetical protein
MWRELVPKTESASRGNQGENGTEWERNSTDSRRRRVEVIVNRSQGGSQVWGKGQEIVPNRIDAATTRR